MEMDFATQVRSDDPIKEEGDDKLRAAVDRLGELESNMRERL
jgi:type IV secretion system protein VirD4